MKKYFVIAFVMVCSPGLISWGPIGHKAVAKIAETHLTPAAKQAVKHILGTETLVEVANYADEIRSDPQFRYTGAYHYVNVPPGLTFEQFAGEIRNMKADNVYKAVLRCEMDLKDPDAGSYKKALALKFLVHLVGDLHQPMHVSNGEDKGGNSISITFNGEQGNLHGLWDGGLIDRQGLNYKQMAETYDTATTVEIKKWQNDDLMMWLWESYQVSTILYREAAQNPNFGEDYYQSHLPTLQKRIEKAGIRLAGILNAIFSTSSAS